MSLEPRSEVRRHVFASNEGRRASRGRNPAPPLRPQLKLAATSAAYFARPLKLGPFKYPASSSRPVEPHELTRFENRSIKRPGSCMFSVGDPKLYWRIKMSIRGGREEEEEGTHSIVGLVSPVLERGRRAHPCWRSPYFRIEARKKEKRKGVHGRPAHSTDDQNSSVVRPRVTGRARRLIRSPKPKKKERKRGATRGLPRRSPILVLLSPKHA
jgi:hypothetical protein